MSTDLVYIIGGQPDEPGRVELRYSLRSFAENLKADYRDVWIVGDPPGWFTGQTVTLPPRPVKFENQRASLTAYANHPDAADELVLLNDDFFLLEPTEPIPIYHRGRHSTWSAVHKGAVKAEGGHPRDCWQCCIVDTADWVAEQTGQDPWIYENHTPVVFSTSRLRDALNTYPQGRRLAIAQLYAIAGSRGEGQHGGNAKCRQAGSFGHKLALPMPFLSCSPETWNGPVGAHVKPMFTDKCRWER